MENISAINVNGKVYVIEDTGARSIMSGVNLLHNWDFCNPVNQRGLLEYIAGTHFYTIDRWFLNSDGTKLSVESGGIRITGSSSSERQGICQRVEHPSKYLSKTYTFSILCDGVIYTVIGTMPDVLLNTVCGTTSTPFGRIEFGIGSNNPALANGTFYCFIQVKPGQSAFIQAVKLEIGTISTLSNDPPMDFGRELAVCQRYYVASPSDMLIRATETYEYNGTVRRGHISFPVTMRANPVINVAHTTGHPNMPGDINVIEGVSPFGFVFGNNEGLSTALSSYTADANL